MLQLRRALAGGSGGGRGAAGGVEPAAPRQRNKFKGTVQSDTRHSAHGEAGRRFQVGAAPARDNHDRIGADAGIAEVPDAHRAADVPTVASERDGHGAVDTAEQPRSSAPEATEIPASDDVGSNGGNEHLQPAAKRLKTSNDVAGAQRGSSRLDTKTKVGSFPA